MRACILLLLIMALTCTISVAGKNSNGAMIVHTNDAYSYTEEGLCVRFDAMDNPGDCQSAGTRTDFDESAAALIWFIAAFLPWDNPGVRVVYFGTDHNLSPGAIAAYGLCGPAGSIEIPDAGWPDSGGNSVGFASPVVGDTFFPFYYFTCYGDGGSHFGSGINPTGGYAAFVDDSNPPQMDRITRFGHVAWQGTGANDCPEGSPMQGACCMPDGGCFLSFPLDCQPPNQYWGDGTVCDPNPCPSPPPGFEACCFEDGRCEDLLPAACVNLHGDPGGVGSACATTECSRGACCFPDGHCQIWSEEACEQRGGSFQGQDTICELNLCPQPPTGACCVDHACSVTTEAQCHGDYQGDDTVCEPNPCLQVPLGACCFDDCRCEVHTEGRCADFGGVYQGDGTVCEEDTCPVPCTGACCLPDLTCEIRTEPSCEADGGRYMGDGSDCDPYPCYPTATEKKSWGRIKALFGS